MWSYGGGQEGQTANKSENLLPYAATPFAAQLSISDLIFSSEQNIRD